MAMNKQLTTIKKHFTKEDATDLIINKANIKILSKDVVMCFAESKMTIVDEMNQKCTFYSNLQICIAGFFL